MAATARMTLGFRPFRAAPHARRWRFDDAGTYGYWWSSSPSGGDAWSRYLIYANPDIVRYYAIHATASRSGVLGMPIERSEGGLTL